MADQIVTAQRVDECARLHVLPKHFGRNMLVIEQAAYQFMGKLAPDYRGALWDFYELSNGGFYMAPQLEPLSITVDGNGFDGTMSADAAGITACLFTFSHLSFIYNDENIAEHYHRLRDFALEHAEHSAIFAATD